LKIDFFWREATMETNPLEDRVKSLVRKTFRLPEGGGPVELRLGDPPDWDSLGHMGLVAALEQEFGIRFPGYALAQLVSVDAIVEALRSQLAST
jgi:acyl carrier protein